MSDGSAASAWSLIKSALIAFLGGSAPIPADGIIQVIAQGDGPTWGTLSGLTAHPTDASRLYAITDQDSAPIRIVEIALTPSSATVIRQIRVVAPGYDGLDTEGIVAKPDGGFWLASEGSTGNAPANLLLETDASGVVQRAIQLPESIAGRMPKKGFEGVALQANAQGGRLIVVFQAPLDGDPPNLTRIGVVDLASETWSFFFYPLEDTKTGDVTGLSDILHLGNNRFAVIERDGRGGKSSLKLLTTFDLPSSAATAADGRPGVLKKQVAVDLVPVFFDSDRKVEKEIEGLTVAIDGEVYAVTDNDGERDTLLLRLGQAKTLF